MTKNRNYLAQFFRHDHLPQKLAEISRPFGELAAKLEEMLPDNPEATLALRNLLEAKDCAVRASIFEWPKTDE